MKRILFALVVVMAGVLNANAEELYLHNQNDNWSAYPAFTNTGTNGNGEVVWVYTLTREYIGEGDFYFRLKYSDYNSDLKPYNSDYELLTDNIKDGCYETYEIKHNDGDNVWGSDRAFKIPHSRIKASEYTITVYAKRENVYYLKVEISKMPVAITTVGYGTFSCNYALDFSDSGLDAYVASGIEGNQVKMTQVTQVPANTGIFLQGTNSANVKVIPTMSYDGTNLLKASNGSEVAASTGGTYHYVFANQNNEPGFYNLTTALTVPAGKAYLETTKALTSDNDAKVALSFGSESTGIKEVEAKENSDWFTVSGVRVAAPTKGFYLHNGKKVVVK